MSGARYRQVYLDEEIDRRRNRDRCKDGEVVYDIYIGALVKVIQQDKVRDRKVDISSSSI
jgi:hypothetical protein